MGTHAKQPTASSHTACVFKSATAPPACEAHIAIGSDSSSSPRPAAGSRVGGTARYRGVERHVVHDRGTSGGEDSSDVVITVQLRK